MKILPTKRLLLEEETMVQEKRNHPEERDPSFLGGGRERMYFVYTETG